METRIYQNPKPPPKLSVIRNERQTLGSFTSEPAILKLHFGTFRATTNASVLFTDNNGVEYEYTPVNARKIADRLRIFVLAAERWEKRISGYYDFKAELSIDGSVLVTHHNFKELMRLSKLRKPSECHACRALVGSMWVRANKKRGESQWTNHDARICETCVGNLLSKPSVRLVSR